MKIYAYPSKSGESRLQKILKRGSEFPKNQVAAVSKIINAVKKRGDQAVVEYTRQFDAPGITPDALTVTAEEMAKASREVNSGFKRTLSKAVSQISSFHRQQLKQSWFDMKRPGTLLGQLICPVDAAGIYVPGGMGGLTPLVSSVLMGAIPAKVAGVKRIAMVTPPMKDGSVNPYLLVAAKKIGVNEIYKFGGAWAIAALAFGTETVKPVDFIAGPGNVYVTIAKKLVAGIVGIDMIAGPSEILVIADDSAHSEFAAADLLSQAEHDAMASAVLITDSKAFASSVITDLSKQLKGLARREIAQQSINQYGAAFVVEDLSAAVDLANRIAPEHLELQVKDPMGLVGRIRNAGAVFMGHFTPEPIGDYIAGPNHVLPTAGTARFSSALSVESFLKQISLIQYSRTAFLKEAKDVMRLAEIEGLGAHAHAIDVRRDKQIEGD